MPTKEDIKQWLKKIGKDRFWLAEKMFVSKRQIDNWLSSNRGIPEVKLQFIHSLMEEENYAESVESSFQRESSTNRTNVNDLSCVAFVVSKNEKRQAEKAAKINGQSLEQFAMEAMLELARRILRESEPQTKPSFDPSLPFKKYPAPSFDPTLAKSVPKQAYAPSFDTTPYTIELVGNISAGNLMEGDTIPETLRISRKYPKGSYALRVCGQSMEPAVADGALIVVRPHTVPPVPKAGTLVVYSDGRGVTLKRLAEHGGSYTLESINPAYPDIEPMDGGRITAVYVETIR